MSNHALDLPYAYRIRSASGVIRTQPEDFLVEEIPSVLPDGAGEHVLIQVEKRETNTDWVAGQLGRFANVPRRDVSYAGMKDRHALTRQWFSVRLAGKPEPDWNSIAVEGFRILQHDRHSRKLKTGALKGNRFTIRVRDFQGDGEALAEVLGQLTDTGIPNYFGEQRFGFGGDNLESAKRLFRGELGKVPRQQKSYYLSAARSYLFNLVLAERVRRGTWNTPQVGDRMILDGSRSSFLVNESDEGLVERIKEHDIHVSGPLWGRGEEKVLGEVVELERQLLEPESLFRGGLVQFGLSMERRALRSTVGDLKWTLENGDLLLSFNLPKGAFATALLRECLDYSTGGLYSAST